MIKHPWRVLVALVVAALAIGMPARASVDEDDREGWRFRLTPYLWIPAIEGDSTVDGRTVKVDISAGDTLDLIGDNLSLVAGFLHGEAHRNRFFLFFDVMLTRLDTDESGELPVPDPRLSASVDATVRMDAVIAELGGGYTLLELALPAHRTFRLEGLLGVRYYYFWTQAKADVQARAELPPGPVRNSVALRSTDTSQWADPFIGLRWLLPICDDFSFNFRGDVGGFGLASDLSWSLNGFFVYELPWRPFGASPALLAGYRALGFDYDGGSDGQNLLMHGAAIGANFAF